ncbi:MAG: tyrosine-protein phosphatase [Bacteroidales bacterium]|nr:tyrosine-protein phosphatase [Bacteroidales bacterium]
MKKLFWALILAIPMFVACGGDEPQEKPGPKVDPELNVTSETEFTLGYPAESVTVTFTANTDWRVATNDLWITATPAEGTGSESPISVTLACAENESLDARTGKVYIFVGKLNATITVTQAGNPMFGAAEEIVSGSTVLATNPNVEKYLTEAHYEDRDGWKTTQILDYYGGFNGKAYNENGEEDPNGTVLSWGNQPTSDQPKTYSIRWKPEDLVAGKDMTLLLEDKLGWSANVAIPAGSYYVNISNLVPNDTYTYKVTVDGDGKILAQGNFNTTGHLHQVFFKKACRNGRDLGGWATIDGKHVKYRKVYRGGRMQSETLTLPGQEEVKMEGIGAQLDLRGKSDVLSAPAIDGFEFCAPVIEEGGSAMLKNDKAKTKQCFEFVVENVRAGRGVYFHCSLGRDRTGTLDILLLGLLGVREGDISKAYEVTYFAPVGYSVSSSEKDSNPKPIFKNTRCAWVYSDVVPYFWSLADETEGKTFADGVEKYLLEVAGVSQKDIDDFRSLMLE